MSTQDSGQQTIEYSASMTGGLTIQDIINSLNNVDSDTEVKSITVKIPVEKSSSSDFNLFPTTIKRAKKEFVETTESESTFDNNDSEVSEGTDDETVAVSTTTVEDGEAGESEYDDSDGEQEHEMPLNEGTDAYNIMKVLSESDSGWMLRDDILEALPEDSGVNSDTIPNTLWRLSDVDYVEKRAYEKDKRKREYTIKPDGKDAILN